MRWSLAVFPLLLLACSPPTPKTTDLQGWTKVPLRYATFFELWSKGSERLVLVHGHGGVADTAGVYHLSPNGAFAGTPFTALRLSLPVDRIALLSTTHVPYLAAVGARSTMVATAFAGEVRDSVVQAALKAGEVKDLGSSEALDRETLIALRPDVVLVYPFSGQGATALKGAGLSVVQVSEYLEEHPLGRAEWLRFFGVLTGHEREADSLFTGIAERYEALAVLAEQDSLRPTVFFGSQWNGQWSVPPGNSYMARLIADAGGRYVFADRTASGNIDLDMETLLSTLDTVDNWGMIAAVDGYMFPRHITNNDPRFTRLKVVQQFHFFGGNTRTADLFGQALLEPDRVLRDLRYCFGDAYRWKPWEDDHPYFTPLRPEPVSMPYEPEEVPLDQ
ncbi:MAG: ABC transporter substrate-binding protein [Flavobacteriales bacterium]|nr:ABC transporter substrate-binding protein [Flavobacteriales bacterium]